MVLTRNFLLGLIIFCSISFIFVIGETTTKNQSNVKSTSKKLERVPVEKEVNIFKKIIKFVIKFVTSILEKFQIRVPDFDSIFHLLPSAAELFGKDSNFSADKIWRYLKLFINMFQNFGAENLMSGLMDSVSTFFDNDDPLEDTEETSREKVEL